MVNMKTGIAALTLALYAGQAAAAELTIDRGKKQQIIEGFGMFGGADVWWSSSEAVLDQAWTHQVIDDLGISMWRNEYYPDASAAAPQDADWAKQRPVVELLSKYAAERKVPLKVLLTIWSPPAGDKCLGAEATGWDKCAKSPPERPANTKGGNIIDPGQRDAYAAWLVKGLKLYRDSGVDVYGLSIQNEPLFWQGYNSCFYEQGYYADTLAIVGSKIKAEFPQVKLFGAENMLGIECGAGATGDAFDNYWYTAAIMNNPGAAAVVDAYAVHGYVDGVTASPTSKLAKLWSSFQDGIAKTGKPAWMTETSGYFHEWPGTAARPGGLDLAQAMYAALSFGHLTAWVYWQGSGKDALNEYSLMQGTTPGKNYYVAKQFYRYIRPGARMVEVTSSDPGVLAVAFEHEAMQSFTVVALNTTDKPQSLDLTGTSLPSEYEAIRTSGTEDAKSLGKVSGKGLSLPAKSVTTFVNGNVYEHLAANLGTGGSGTGGSGAGGTNGSGATTGVGGTNGASTGATGSGAINGAAASSSTSSDAASDDSGCGCRTAPRQGGGLRSALAALLGFALVAGRRRSRHR